MFGFLLIRVAVWREMAVKASLCDEYRQRADKAERERDAAVLQLEASRVEAWRRCQEVENRMLTKTLQTFGVPVAQSVASPVEVPLSPTYSVLADPEKLSESDRTLYDFHLEGCVAQGMDTHHAARQAWDLLQAEKRGQPLPYQLNAGLFS